MAECERFDPYYPQIPIAEAVGGDVLIFSRTAAAVNVLPITGETCLIQQLVTGDAAGERLLCEGCGYCAGCRASIRVESEGELQVASLRGR